MKCNIFPAASIRQGVGNWPRYVTFEEDCKLHKPKWNAKYGGLNSKDPVRVVMWDMTNIPVYAFSDADLNRFTYSVYYAMNCFKGGIFIQLCGWMGTAHLWVGAVSDTDYNKRAGYMEEQEQFAEEDLVLINGVLMLLAFMNIYGKGYRAKAVAHRAGKQLVLQPDFVSPRAISISTAIKHCIQRLWLQIEVVMSVQ